MKAYEAAELLKELHKSLLSTAANDPDVPWVHLNRSAGVAMAAGVLFCPDCEGQGVPGHYECRTCDGTGWRKDGHSALACFVGKESKL